MSGKLRDRFKDDFVEMAKRLVTSYETDAIQNCITCVSFDEKKELCSLYKLKPPARVIAYGCPSYTNTDEIPF